MRGGGGGSRSNNSAGPVTNCKTTAGALRPRASGGHPVTRPASPPATMETHSLGRARHNPPVRNHIVYTDHKGRKWVLLPFILWCHNLQSICTINYSHNTPAKRRDNSFMSIVGRYFIGTNFKPLNLTNETYYFSQFSLTSDLKSKVRPSAAFNDREFCNLH